MASKDSIKMDKRKKEKFEDMVVDESAYYLAVLLSFHLSVRNSPTQSNKVEYRS